MSYEHKSLAEGRWSQMPFVEQMANIGSEVERALNWQAKHNADYCQRAFFRCLELIDLTLAGLTDFARLKEIARLREAIAGYFLGQNEFKYDAPSLRKYFAFFTFATRRKC